MGAKRQIRARAAARAARTSLAAKRPSERGFWIALGCAAIAHIAMIAVFVHSLPQRQVGEKVGRSDGVSVAMVDAADLASRNTFAKNERAPRSMSQIRPAPPKSQAPLPEERPQEVTPREAAPPSDPKSAPALVTPQEIARQADKQAKEDKQEREKEKEKEEGKDKEKERDKENQQAKAKQKEESLEWPIDPKGLEQGFSKDQSAAKPRDAAAASKQAAETQERQVAKASPPLQLSLPDSALSLDVDFSRPAGITRSGENDEFGRAVLQALRKTMPDMNEQRRVTVRFVLSQDGNLLEVRLVRPSGNPRLDQAVMFAVQQSSFPFPPANAAPVDRTFTVTYIYSAQ
ncbi:MAG: energy transducer TonB [Hyphomicrobiaceae bacterium]|nr:energy transducer TonB [Hyphomicrobiaceae bacterium]